MYFELYSLDILELMENKKENIECVKEDTGISVEDQEIMKKKVRYKEEDIKESNVANPGVSGLSHLYLGNFFYLKFFDHHQMVDW